MQNRFYKFVHFQLFSVKYKFVHLRLFDVKFLFSQKHIFDKQKITAFYGRASVVSDFKPTWENDDLLSSRHKSIFEVPHPVHEYTKMRIPGKRCLTNTAGTFWDSWNGSALRYLGVDHFDRYRTKIYGKEEKR